MRKHTPQQTDHDFLLVKRSFLFLRDVAGMSLEEIADYCGRHPGTLDQYRCNTRTTPPEIREKLTELAKVKGYDPIQAMNEVS